MKKPMTVEKLVDKMFAKQEDKPFALLSSLVKRLGKLNKKLIAVEKKKEETLISLNDKYGKFVNSGLTQEAAMQAIITEYAKDLPKPKRRAKRISNKIEASDNDALLNFVKNAENGVSIKEITAQFSSLNKKVIQVNLKKLVKTGAITATGKTRSRKYTKVAEGPPAQQ